MKVIDTPRTGKISTSVAYMSPYGPCYRAFVVPHDPRTPAQIHARQAFGSSSRGWGLRLTESQREDWNLAAQTVPSCPSLSQYSNLSGQQFCVKINSTLRCVGQSPLNEPPAPIVFSPNGGGQLTIDYDEAGNVRLLVAVGAAVEDIMLFGQAPCSAGRMKKRRVNYLGWRVRRPTANATSRRSTPPGSANPLPGRKCSWSPVSTRTAGKARTT